MAALETAVMMAPVRAVMRAERIFGSMTVFMIASYSSYSLYCLLLVLLPIILYSEYMAKLNLVIINRFFTVCIAS